RRERRELVDHGIHGARVAEEFALERAALDLERDALREIALRDGADDARHFGGRVDEVVDQRVDRRDRLLPRAADVADAGALRNLALLADALADALEFLHQPLVDLDQLVEFIRDLAVDAAQAGGHSDREIPFAQARERGCKLTFIEAGRKRDQRDHGGGGLDSAFKNEAGPISTGRRMATANDGRTAGTRLLVATDAGWISNQTCRVGGGKAELPRKLPAFSWDHFGPFIGESPMDRRGARCNSRAPCALRCSQGCE